MKRLDAGASMSTVTIGNTSLFKAAGNRQEQSLLLMSKVLSVTNLPQLLIRCACPQSLKPGGAGWEPAALNLRSCRHIYTEKSKSRLVDLVNKENDFP